MALETDFTGFHEGEYIEIVILAKNPDGTTLTTPASQLMTMTIATTPDGPAALEFSTATGEITLTDAGTAEFTIQLAPADVTTLSANVTYYHNIWTEIGASQPVLQARGRIILNAAIPRA